MNFIVAKNGYGFLRMSRINGRCYDMNKKTKYSTIKNILGRDTGMTMLETLIAFLVLTIVLAALYGMVVFSTNLRMRAIDTEKVRSEFNQEIYMTSPTSKVDVYSYVGKSKDNKTMFMLQLSSQTSNYNLKTGSEGVDIAKFQNNVKLPNIDAKGFVSTDSRIQSERLVTPKALTFMYHKVP